MWPPSPRKRSQRAGQSGANETTEHRPADVKKRHLDVEEVIASPAFDLGTLVLLAVGDWSGIADPEWPPEDVRRWVETADIRQIRGLLLTTLQRWHELRHGEIANH